VIQFIYFYNKVSSTARSLPVIILTTLLCRMKSDECARKRIYDIGFVDPKRINERLLREFAKETEANLLRFLQRQVTKRRYCFLTTSSKTVTVLYTLIFAYSMLSVTDELLTYINVCSYHYILLIIQVNSGRVEIYDSLAKPKEKYKSIIDALQR